jgi:hypothetical protein
MVRTENVSSIIACSLIAGETTSPQSSSPATAVILSPVYVAVTWQCDNMYNCKPEKHLFERNSIIGPVSMEPSTLTLFVSSVIYLHLVFLGSWTHKRHFCDLGNTVHQEFHVRLVIRAWWNFSKWHKCKSIQNMCEIFICLALFATKMK